MGALSVSHWLILLIAVVVVVVVIGGVYWLIRLAVRHGTRDSRR